MLTVPLRRLAIACAVALVLVRPAEAQDVPSTAQIVPADPAIGEYAAAQMELAAGIRLNPDGTFDYGLTVGSLDEQARGRWKRVGQRIELLSDPKPVPPSITADRIEAAPGEPFAIRLLAPNGRDIAGVDLRIDFDNGEPVESYLAGGPWSLPADEKRTPRFVTFSMRAYRIDSGPLPLLGEDGTVANFLLMPNDFGVVDLTGAYLEPDGEDLILVRPDGSLTFKRIYD